MIGMEGTRLLREKRGQGRPRRRTAEEAPGPPAESECLEWKSLHITLSGNPLLSANCLPCLIKASAYRILTS
ncbi:hypothetical protein DOZ91_00360 [Peribacillus frigoritolerans]|nr:hypothetical protein DOZ91_00360 [Peribacillus frigoritolerans]